MIKVDSSAPLTKEWHVEDWKAKVGRVLERRCRTFIGKMLGPLSDGGTLAFLTPLLEPFKGINVHFFRVEY